MAEDTLYTQSLNPKGYVNNRDITSLGEEQFLVRGSRNVLIENQEKVVSRPGFALKGAAKTVNAPITASYEWQTSTNVERPLRKYSDILEVWVDGAWREITDGYSNNTISWTTWWDNNELIDTLIFVNEDDVINEWSGGVTQVASVTSNTITKIQYLTDTSISFNNNGSSLDTIDDANSGFNTAQFAVGEVITVSGSNSNDGTYTISDVTAGTLTLSDEDILTDEAAGNTVTIADKNTGTWAEARFFTSNTREVIIGGTVYTYTGGTDTGTLTGVSPDPSSNNVSASDYAIQNIRTYTPSELDGLRLDLVNTLYNQVWFGSTRSRVINIAADSDFTDFTFSSPVRTPGEGAQLRLDQTPTAMVQSKTEGNMLVSTNPDFWYRIVQELTSDQTGETFYPRVLDTARREGARSEDAVFNIRNTLAVITFEPTVDQFSNLGGVEASDNLPISDDIKEDIENYDLTNAHGVYWQRRVYIALPAEGAVIIYDVQYGHWHPPQDIPVRRLGIIDDQLVGHSSFANETYVLMDEDNYNDNGASFTQVAAFGYQNYERRFSLKQFDEFATELRANAATELTARIRYDWLSSTDEVERVIDASDQQLFPPIRDQGGLGKQSLGTSPLGSVNETMAGASSGRPMPKGRVIFEVPAIDYFERQRVFETSSRDARFELLAYGENIRLSPNQPDFIKR